MSRSRMEFLEHNQIRAWAQQHGLASDDASDVRLPHLPSHHRGVYAHGRRSDAERAAADDLIAHLGAWTECVVWITQWGIWPSGEDWPRFYGWRGRLGERRSLDIAPGHLFRQADVPVLAELLALIMENAWDAEIICSSPENHIVARGTISRDADVGAGAPHQTGGPIVGPYKKRETPARIERPSSVTTRLACLAEASSAKRRGEGGCLSLAACRLSLVACRYSEAA